MHPNLMNFGNSPRNTTTNPQETQTPAGKSAARQSQGWRLPGGLSHLVVRLAADHRTRGRRPAI